MGDLLCLGILVYRGSLFLSTSEGGAVVGQPQKQDLARLESLKKGL